ncbi:hypothetical protein HanRHA438_Chr17g0831831 [Helianthus annuus]|nr:hypothetical protein HanRHA438_Chr17g0831831 [Helianthus annuus]
MKETRIVTEHHVDEGFDEQTGYKKIYRVGISASSSNSGDFRFLRCSMMQDFLSCPPHVTPVSFRHGESETMFDGCCGVETKA